VPGELKGAPGHGADPLDAFGLGLSRFIIGALLRCPAAVPVVLMQHALAGTQLVLVGVQLPYKCACRAAAPR